jgi:hypothetical protein
MEKIKTESKPTPRHELIADKKAIHEELKKDRERKTVRVKSELP